MKNGKCTNIATIWQNNIKSGLFNNEQKLKNSYSISYSTKNMKITQIAIFMLHSSQNIIYCIYFYFYFYFYCIYWQNNEKISVFHSLGYFMSC